MLINTDYLMVEKLNESEYRVYYLYPNEDYDAIEKGEEKKVTLWTAHHRYSPSTDGSISHFTNEVECNAYLDYADTPSEFIPSNAKWFSSEKLLERNLKSLEIGDVAVAVYKKNEFVVSTLNCWLDEDDDVYDYFGAEFDVSREEIVERFGFLYSSEEDIFIKTLDGDDIVDINMSIDSIFEYIIELEKRSCVSKEAKIDFLNLLWSKVDF